MSVQNRLQAGATKIIAKLGADFTVSNIIGPPVYDPETGLVTENRQTYTIRGVAVEYTQQINGQSTANGTQILIGDKRFYCDPTTAKQAGIAATYVPNASSSDIMLGVVKYQVVNVKEVNPTGNHVIAYELQLRK